MEPAGVKFVNILYPNFTQNTKKINLFIFLDFIFLLIYPNNQNHQRDNRAAGNDQ
jgi:hypothetical protein